ncbi:MAG: hypothetical protein WKG07_21240 [Hymenobacter sp.]
MTTYNGKFFRANNLTVQPALALGADQEMVVVQTLAGPRWRRATPPSCAGRSRRWRGCVGRATRPLVISVANLALLQAAGGDLAGYQQFYQKVYP